MPSSESSIAKDLEGSGSSEASPATCLIDLVREVPVGRARRCCLASCSCRTNLPADLGRELLAGGKGSPPDRFRFSIAPQAERESATSSSKVRSSLLVQVLTSRSNARRLLVADRVDEQDQEGRRLDRVLDPARGGAAGETEVTADAGGEGHGVLETHHRAIRGRARAQVPDSRRFGLVPAPDPPPGPKQLRGPGAEDRRS